MNKGSNENYTGLKEDVRSFIVSFYEHVKEQNVVEVENDCQIQHVYARLSSTISVEDMVQSFSNYCSLFNTIVEANQPLSLSLPNQWLWDIIDEFLYQFQKFCTFRNRQKHKSEDEACMLKHPRTWSVHDVLSVLYSLVKKSGINEQLSYYAKQGDPDEIADEFGRSSLYKMLGFFSLIGLCRLHCILGDYYTAIKVLENIKINRLEMYHDVPTCHITTGYYVSFAYLMMRRYHDATQSLTTILAYKSRATSFFQKRPDLRDYVTKQTDQMLFLLSLSLTLGWMPTDYNSSSVDLDRRDKFFETLTRLQQLDEAEFSSSYDLGRPKFISPEMPSAYGNMNSVFSVYLNDEPQRQQTELFREEICQQINLLKLRSYLKLYINMPTSKLAGYMNCSESDVHSYLMAFKYRLKQANEQQQKQVSMELMEATGSIDTTQSQQQQQQQQQPNHTLYQLLPDLDLYLDKSMVHIADTTMDRRFSEYFIRHIEMLLNMNKTLDALENRIHENNGNLNNTRFGSNSVNATLRG